MLATVDTGCHQVAFDAQHERTTLPAIPADNAAKYAAGIRRASGRCEIIAHRGASNRPAEIPPFEYVLGRQRSQAIGRRQGEGGRSALRTGLEAVALAAEAATKIKARCNRVRITKSSRAEGLVRRQRESRWTKRSRPQGSALPLPTINDEPRRNFAGLKAIRRHRAQARL